jgi:hypothetical protein
MTGQGFNDPTPAAPVGGNPGTTIGQQRLIAFQFAADIWGSRLRSNVPIIVGASWQTLNCGTDEASLAEFGPRFMQINFVNAPLQDTFYADALANSLAGIDLNPGVEEISGRLNVSLGTAGCLPNNGWYYGLDGNSPSNRTDLVSTVLHELGHGLGFTVQFNLATGAKLGVTPGTPFGFNDSYMVNLVQLGAMPSDYPSMTNSQRVAASISGNVFWIGENVRSRSGLLTAGKAGQLVQMFAPNPLQLGSSISHWDPGLMPDQMMEPRFTVVIRNPVLEMPALKDIGWIVPATSRNAHDFNGDGWSDVLWRNTQSGQVLAWMVECTQGGGCNQLSAVSLGTPPPLDWTIVGQRDFNGDARDDILWRNGTSGQVLVWLLDRDPQNPNDRTRLVLKGAGSPPISPTRDWSVAGTGDFNGDGFADILWRNTQTGQVVIWQLRCNGTGQNVACPIIGAASPPTVTLDWEIKGTGDFNGDGFADFLWYNNQTGQALIWLLRCTANDCPIIGSGVPGTPPRDWTVAGTGDFNGDGRTDIVWFNNTTRQTLIWLIGSDGTSVIFGAVPALTPPPPWQIAETGDFNGDGTSDILWNIPMTGETLVWLIKSTVVIGGGPPGAPAPPPWQLQIMNAD